MLTLDSFVIDFDCKWSLGVSENPRLLREEPDRSLHGSLVEIRDYSGILPQPPLKIWS